MFHLVSYKRIRKTQVIPEYVVFYKIVGRLWRVSDCEELVGVTWRVSDCEELVGGFTGDDGGVSLKFEN